MRVVVLVQFGKSNLIIGEEKRYGLSVNARGVIADELQVVCGHDLKFHERIHAPFEACLCHSVSIIIDPNGAYSILMQLLKCLVIVKVRLHAAYPVSTR
jgi:hypothetical protein